MSTTPEPGWLLAAIARATARSEQIPRWARPTLVKKQSATGPNERETT